MSHSNLDRSKTARADSQPSRFAFLTITSGARLCELRSFLINTVCRLTGRGIIHFSWLMLGEWNRLNKCCNYLLETLISSLRGKCTLARITMGFNGAPGEAQTLIHFTAKAAIMNITIYIRLFKTKSKEKPSRTISRLRREKAPSCFANRDWHGWWVPALRERATY